MQAILILKFAYTGVIEGLNESELKQLNEDVKHLKIVGLEDTIQTVVVKTELTDATGAADDIAVESGVTVLLMVPLVVLCWVYC